MTRFMHAQVFAVVTDDPDPVSETFSAEVNEERPEEAALKLAGWLRQLAADLEQGAQE